MTTAQLILVLLPALAPLLKILLPAIWNVMHAPETAEISAPPDADDAALQSRLDDVVRSTWD